MKKMNRSLAILLLFGMTTFGYPQAAVPTRTHGAKNPNHHQIHQRVRQAIRQIQKDEKSGKITKVQAAALRAKVKAVHDQQKAYAQQGHGGDLNADQSEQLNRSLDGIGSSH